MMGDDRAMNKMYDGGVMIDYNRAIDRNRAMDDGVIMGKRLVIYCW